MPKLWNRKFKELRKRLARVVDYPEASVHEVRLLSKIVRAGLRFYDPQLKVSRQLNDQTSKATRALAPYREVEAQLALARWLKARGLALQLRVAPTSARSQRMLVRRVRSLVKILKKDLEHLGRLSRRKGKLSFTRLEKAYQQYVEHPDAERLHALRKRAKCLEYQLKYFAGKSLRNLYELELVSKVGEDLGRARDLWLLQESLKVQAKSRLSDSTSKELVAIHERCVRRALRRLRKLI